MVYINFDDPEVFPTKSGLMVLSGESDGESENFGML